MNNLTNSKSLELLTKLVREKIDGATGTWEKPFFSNPKGTPRNVFTKHTYNGFNPFLLGLVSEIKGYEYGAWASYKQYSDNGVFINKGERGTPVAFWKIDFVMKDDYTKSVSVEDYRMLTTEEKEKYKERLFLKEYYLFNVEQTNMREVKPDMFEKVRKMFSTALEKDETGQFFNQEFDKMVANQSFICPIYVKDCGRAYFSRTSVSITVPSKKLYKDDKQYYSTLAHECAHATMIPLNRETNGTFGSEKYAREELVAEIASALIGMQLGFSTTIEDDNAQYLKSWETALNEEDKKSFLFLYNVVKDATKASELVLNCIQEKDVKVA